MNLDLTVEETAALLRELVDITGNDRYPVPGSLRHGGKGSSMRHRGSISGRETTRSRQRAAAHRGQSEILL